MPRTKQTAPPARQKRGRGHGGTGTKQINGHLYHFCSKRVVVDGKRQRKYWYGKSLSEAIRKRDADLIAMAVAPPREPDARLGGTAETVRSYAERFFEQDGLAPNTRNSYRSTLQLHCFDVAIGNKRLFGDLPLSMVTGHDLKSLYDAQRTTLRTMPSMRKRVHGTLSALFAYAKREGDIAQSPVASLLGKPPTHRVEKRKPLCADEAKKLIAIARKYRLGETAHRHYPKNLALGFRRERGPDGEATKERQRAHDPIAATCGR
jgi:hypothetical protein